MRKQNQFLSSLCSLLLIACVAACGQTTAGNSSVPQLVKYSGIAKDVNNNALTGVVGATFAIYADQQGGAPLWIETQNIQADANGNFSVMLGNSRSQGLPADLFSDGQARWLGISFNGQSEQPRVALLSVPYALKAADATTLGGLPASAFVLAAPPTAGAAGTANPAPAASSSSSTSTSAPPPVGGGGTLDFIPLWTDNNGTLGNSVLFQSGTGATAKIGVNNTKPAATLDVKGSTALRGILQLPTLGNATATAGFNSQPLNQQASAFNSSTSKAVNQAFQWQAEPAGNNTANPSATLNLLFGSGTTKPAETGLKLSSTGLFTFATGQTFPGAGTITGVTTASGSGLSGGGTTGSLNLSLLNTCSTNQILQWNGSAWACATASGGGTITGVTAGTDLSGGGTSGNVTLSLNTLATDTRYAQLAANDSYTGSQTVNVNGGNYAVSATQSAASGQNYAVIGTSSSPTARAAAILGQNLSSTLADPFGVQGFVASPSGAGVFGQNGLPLSTTGGNEPGFAGVWGDAGTTINVAGVLGTADNSDAILGLNNSPSVPAIFGLNLSNNSVAVGTGGITGSPEGFGVWGVGVFDSITFSNHFGFQPFGVVGDAGDSGGGTPIGVWGVADSGFSVVGENTSSSTPAAAFLNLSDTPGNPAFTAGSDIGLCTIDASGDLACTGSKSAVVKLPDQRWVRLYAVESAESWFDDYGSAQLSNGAAQVSLDPTYLQTVNTGADYHVFLTPNGDSRGLYVASKTATSFEVREQGGGRSNIAFDYRIVAKRKGYENVRMADMTAHQKMAMTSIQQLARKNDPKTRSQLQLPLLRRPTGTHSVPSSPIPGLQAPSGPSTTVRSTVNTKQGSTK
jgi:hypothetical protein